MILATKWQYIHTTPYESQCIHYQCLNADISDRVSLHCSKYHGFLMKTVVTVGKPIQECHQWPSHLVTGDQKDSGSIGHRSKIIKYYSTRYRHRVRTMHFHGGSTLHQPLNQCTSLVCISIRTLKLTLTTYNYLTLRHTCTLVWKAWKHNNTIC